MESFFEPHFTWASLGFSMIALVCLYIVLFLVKNKALEFPIHKKYREILFTLLRNALLLYELLFAVIVGSIFLLINPLWHGILILFLVVITFPLIRNYVTGKLLCFDQDLHVGKTLITNEIRGVINKMNGLGIYIITNDGVYYSNYTSLQKNGFSLVLDSETNEYCYLNISSADGQEINLNTLSFKLMAIPYLDASYPPNFTDSNNSTMVQVKILIRSGKHRYEVIQLIEGWGYQCNLSH